MNPSDDYLHAVEQIVAPLAAAYGALDAAPDELPAVKYPRAPFSPAAGEENRYGAWYVKTSIKGKPAASSPAAASPSRTMSASPGCR